MGTSGESVRNSRIETIFYITFLITAVHAGFILWDMAAMLPGAGALPGGAAQNGVHASGYMSTLYLTFLGAYASYKEFLRWTGAPQGELPEEQVKRFRRGEIIVTFWAVLAVIAVSFFQLKLIPRLPHELFRTTLQAIGILFGTYASKGLCRKRSAQKARAEEDKAAFGKAVIEHVAANGYIDNSGCQKLTGLSRNDAYRLLKSLKADGTLQTQGQGKGLKYVSPA